MYTNIFEKHIYRIDFIEDAIYNFILENGFSFVNEDNINFTYNELHIKEFFIYTAKIGDYNKSLDTIKNCIRNLCAILNCTCNIIKFPKYDHIHEYECFEIKIYEPRTENK